MSTAQKRGANYDNEIANVLQEHTDEGVAVHSMRGSGNTKHPQPDVLIRRNHHDVALELKRTSVATGEHYYVDEEDLVQLAKCRNDLTHAWLGLKFTRRELAVQWIPQRIDDENIVGALVEDLPDAFDPHITNSGTLRVTKPDTDSWPSATAGRTDVQVLSDELNVDLV